MTSGILNPTTGRFVDMVSPVNRLCPLNRGLVAWWLILPGTTGGARLMDIMSPGPHGRHGTLINIDPAIDWKGPSRRGGFGTLNYDGSVDRVDLKSDLLLASGESFTLSVWVYARSLATRFAFSVGAAVVPQGPHIGSHSSGVWRFGVWGGGQVDNATDHTTDTWHHLVGTYDGTNGRLYANGVLIGGPSALTFTGTDGTGRLGILNNLGSLWNGFIDDARFYRRIISGYEVEHLYYDALKGYPDTLNWIEEPAVTFAAAAGGTTSPWYQYQQQLAGAV